MTDKTQLMTSEQLFAAKYGQPGTPGREEFHAKSTAWFYGEILRDRRKALKMTQQQLADKVRVPRTYISKVERGENDLRLSSFLRIVNVLGLDIRLQQP